MRRRDSHLLFNGAINVPTRFPVCLAILASLVLWTVSPLRSALAQYEGAESPPEQIREGFESIRDDQAEEWLSVLASAEFAGRGTGQPGYAKAAQWVADRLAGFGWAPIGDDGTYFQNVPLTRITPDAQASSITGPNDLKISGEKDLGFTNHVSGPAVTGKVVFVNARGADQKLSADLALKGKFVVFVEKDTGSTVIRAIMKKQPAAIIRVTQDKPTSRTRFVSGKPSSRQGRIDAVVSEQAAQKLAEAVGAAAELVKPREETGLKIEEVDAELTVELKLSEQPLKTPNVVAWFEGSDPEVKHEYVTIGAHLDHLGERRGEVYLGADDNASGTTAILQIAEAISKNPVKPRRSVLFIAFAAEELGLLGSRHYCEHPLKPIKDMICMLNLDMVARNEENDKETAEENEDTMHLVGTKKIAIGLHETALEANRHVSFQLEFDAEKVFNRSDHASFHRKGVPVVFIFCGFGPRYHRTTDTLEAINYHKLASAARLGYVTLMKTTDHGHYERQPETSAKASPKK